MKKTDNLKIINLLVTFNYQGTEQSKTIHVDIYQIINYYELLQFIEKEIKINKLHNKEYQIIYNSEVESKLIEYPETFDKIRHDLLFSSTNSLNLNAEQPSFDLSSLGSKSLAESIYLHSCRSELSISEQSNDDYANFVGKLRKQNIKIESKALFSEIKNFLKCLRCKNYLFGATSCSRCKEIYCIECIELNNNYCPDRKCYSKDFEEIKDDVKNLLCEVKVECENWCGDPNLTMYNYYEHLKTCQIAESIVIDNDITSPNKENLRDLRDLNCNISELKENFEKIKKENEYLKTKENNKKTEKIKELKKLRREENEELIAKINEMKLLKKENRALKEERKRKLITDLNDLHHNNVKDMQKLKIEKDKAEKVKRKKKKF